MSSVGTIVQSQTERNKLVARRFAEEVINQGHLDVIDEIFARTYVNHAMGGMTTLAGPEGEKQLVTSFRSAFPDGRVDLTYVLAEHDLVAAYGQYSGTHLGDFQGMPATGQHFSVPLANIFRVIEGRIADNWSVFDTFGLLQQLQRK